MKNNINIIKNKNNTLELDIEIEGIETKTAECYLVISTDEMDLSFKCLNTIKTTWSVVIPAISRLEATSYSFHIYMVIDGYYFKPHTGVITVTNSNEIIVSDISNKSLKATRNTEKAHTTKDIPKPDKKDKKIPKATESKKTTKRSISDIATKIMTNNPTILESTKIMDNKVRDILKNI